MNELYVRLNILRLTGKSFGGMTQFSLGVSGVSSSGTGFTKSGLVLIFGRWATLVSSYYEICTSSGIGTSSTGYSDREAEFCLEELVGASMCQRSSKLRTSELEAVLKPKHLNHAFYSCFGQSLLEEVEKDPGHHDIYYVT
ncbi:hypothetical protein Tco_0253137 [Tanacetum coccineum]